MRAVIQAVIGTAEAEPIVELSATENAVGRRLGGDARQRSARGALRPGDGNRWPTVSSSAQGQVAQSVRASA
jgi:hypothetical protein